MTSDRTSDLLLRRIRDSHLTFTETAGLAATRLEFGGSGRQQVVCVVTDPAAPAFVGHGRVSVYSVIKDQPTGDELLRVMGALGEALPLGGFRLHGERLVLHMELPLDPEAEDLERVVITCGQIADACEALLMDGGDVS